MLGQAPTTQTGILGFCTGGGKKVISITFYLFQPTRTVYQIVLLLSCFLSRNLIMDVLLLDRLSKLVSKLLVEPDPILPIDIQAIMGMTIRGGSIVNGKGTDPTCREGAENTLE